MVQTKSLKEQKQLDRVWEAVTWFVVSFALLMAILFHQEKVNLLAVAVISNFALIGAVIFFRIVPKESNKFISYSFEVKSLMVGLLDIILISMFLVFARGLESPFFFMYFLVLIAGSLVLRKKYFLYEVFLALILIPCVGFFCNQLSLEIILPGFLSIISVSIISWQTGKVITKQKEHISQLDQFKSDFISITLHQIKNPLTALRWFLSDILLPEPIFNKKTRYILNRLYFHIIRLILLVNNLRDLVRLEIDKSINIKPVDILELTQDSIDGFRTIFKEQGIEIVLKKALEPILVKADLLFLSHVIKNLIFNAIIYNQPNGVIVIDIKKMPTRVNFSIHNTGIGIRLQDQKNVFKKFFRSEDAQVINPSGSGLSLFLAKLIIEACEGKIKFISKYKRETTFSFILPLVK